MPEPHLSPITKYLRQRGIGSQWSLEGTKATGFQGAIVIPSLAERANLSSTLESLSANPAKLLERFLVVVVVNHRPDASEEYKRNNRETVRYLEEHSRTWQPLCLAWVDATSSETELPLKGGGVGMARKIGFDLSLPRLDFLKNPLLVSLDADTLVAPTYLDAIISHFERTTAGGAAIPFRHRTAPNAEQQAAIDRYELFLRCYVYGLHKAGSPYAFHTIGSAFACRAAAYVKMGGMNTRCAGEDFYFLQHLHRIAGVETLTGTAVYPSCRASDRVPFGTGRSMTRLLAREPEAVLFYQTGCYRILKDWLSIAPSAHHIDANGIVRCAGRISLSLADHLEISGIGSAWDRLRNNNTTPERFRRGFHEWFDGLRTMKLIHHLSATVFPRTGPEQAVNDLLAWGGETTSRELTTQLATLRAIQSGACPEDALIPFYP